MSSGAMTLASFQGYKEPLDEEAKNEENQAGCVQEEAAVVEVFEPLHDCILPMLLMECRGETETGIEKRG